MRKYIKSDRKSIAKVIKVNLWAPRRVIFQTWAGFMRGPIFDDFRLAKSWSQNVKLFRKVEFLAQNDPKKTHAWPPPSHTLLASLRSG